MGILVSPNYSFSFYVYMLKCVDFYVVLSFVLNIIAKRLKLRGFKRLSNILQALSVRWNRFWISPLLNSYHQLIDGRENERITNSIKQYSHQKELMFSPRKKIREKFVCSKFV